MKICMVTPTFFPMTGGTEVAIYEIATRLIKQGHEIVLITRRRGSMKRMENIEGIDVHRVFFISNPADVLLLQFSLFNELKHIARAGDIIHQFHPYIMGLTTVLTKKMFKKPLVLSLMGSDSFNPIRPVRKISYPYLAWVMNSSDVITSPSQDLANHAREQGCKKRIEIVPHGVNIDKFNLDNNGTEIRNKLGIGDNEIMVLSIQRLVEKKGVKYLISAIPNIIKENPNVKFAIGGKGPEREKLENLAKKLNITKNVIFTGFISNEELPKFYSASNIFAFPTLYEQFGITYVEAMASGVPILTTKQGAAPEIIEDGKTGLIVPPRDSEALADAILRLADSEKIRAEMGKAGREKAVKEYDWNKIVNRYQDIYEELIK